MSIKKRFGKSEYILLGLASVFLTLGVGRAMWVRHDFPAKDLWGMTAVFWGVPALISVCLAFAPKPSSTEDLRKALKDNLERAAAAKSTGK